MPHALLLSPDDQAVSAITGVLEELSVTCERPLDGVSAAQKLNSQSFDLVLVDCENLPAAKLIFDVCRRGKNGNNPVPIAIVDGRAGLPTAFRLGAELILTKPVSKDQARTTIRTAVGRVRKDVTPIESSGPQAAISAAPVVTPANMTVPEKSALAVAASASPQLTSFADADRKFNPTLVSGATPEPVASFTTRTVGALFSSSVTESTELFEPPVKPAVAESSAPAKIAFIPSDDPVLAELERTELEESIAAQPESAPLAPPKIVADLSAGKSEEPVLSSYAPTQSRGHSVFVALLMLVVAGGGLYAAWMYQPGFRALAQPQINRVLTLAGMSVPETQKPYSSQPAPPQPAAPVQAAAPAPTPVPSDDLSKAPAGAPESVATTGSNPTAATVTPPASATQATTANAPPLAAPVAATPAPIAPAVSKPEISKPAQNKVKELKRDAIAAVAADAPLPGESNAIILSSKGAEKRLAHSVSPKYPADARPDAAEGTVVLKEVVDENGNVTGLRLVEGNAALATAAMQAVKQWRYRPYVRDGKAQPFQTVVIVDFQKQ